MPSSDETIKILARNIKSDPEDSFSKFALALEFLKQDNIQRAKILFEDIYSRDPGYVGVYYHLGKLYEHLERTDDALRMYTEGMEVALEQKEQRTLNELKEARIKLNEELEN